MLFRSSNLLKRGKLTPVISTELRNTAGRALIGRFDVESERAEYHLFAVAEKVDGTLDLTLADLNVLEKSTVFDGGRKTIETDDKNERLVDYVDQLDVNNDGVDEIITKESVYEGQAYKVWSFSKQLGWRSAHWERCGI